MKSVRITFVIQRNSSSSIIFKKFEKNLASDMIEIINAEVHHKVRRLTGRIIHIDLL